MIKERGNCVKESVRSFGELTGSAAGNFAAEVLEARKNISMGGRGNFAGKRPQKAWWGILGLGTGHGERGKL